MPHVPEELKERLKREVSIQRLAEARGIQLVRKGKSLMGLCPFHEDHNPSLSIDPAENRWHCFGCGQKGDVIEWVMRAEGVSFNHAVELLNRDSVPFAGSAGAPPKQSTVPKLPPLFQPNADDQTVLQVVVNYYHETLKNSPQAQQYLVKRGLRIRGDDRALPAGLCQPHVELSHSGEEPGAGPGAARAVGGAGHPARKRPGTST